MRSLLLFVVMTTVAGCGTSGGADTGAGDTSSGDDAASGDSGRRVEGGAGGRDGAAGDGSSGVHDGGGSDAGHDATSGGQDAGSGDSAAGSEGGSDASGTSDGPADATASDAASSDAAAGDAAANDAAAADATASDATANDGAVSDAAASDAIASEAAASDAAAGADSGEGGIVTGSACGDASGLQAGAPWPMRGRCPTRMARADVAGPARANLRWSQWLGPNQADITQFDSVVSSPAIAADGTIYIGVQGTGLVASGLLAFAPDGTEKWHYDTGLNAVESGAVVRADGSLVFASADGTLVALEPTGQLRWSTSLGAPAFASPLVGPDGTIYEGTSNGIVAVQQDGTIAWTSPGCDVGTGGASLYPDGSIRFNCQGAVMMLTASGAPGSQNLSATDGMQVIYAPPTIGPGGEVWFAANSVMPNQSPSATLYSYSAAAGFQKREFGWDSTAFFNSPALLPSGDAVTGVPYPDPPNNQGAFGAGPIDGGFTQWQAYPQRIQVQPSVDVDGNVYFIDGTTVVSLDSTGAPRWTSGVDSGVQYGLAIGSDGTIYAGTVNGYLYAFGP